MHLMYHVLFDLQISHQAETGAFRTAARSMTRDNETKIINFITNNGNMCSTPGDASHSNGRSRKNESRTNHNHGESISL